MKQKLQMLGAALMLCTTPLFAEDFAVGGIYYNITSSTDKTVEVTCRGDYFDSYSNEYSGAVTIPESVTYNGNTYSVTSIGYKAFCACDNLTSVEIPNSVTSIEGWAFRDCSSLTSVEIPNSVTSIGDDAFSCCTGLTSVVIPNSVTSIGEWAFLECSSLTSVEIGNSVTSIGDYAFDGCSSLTSIAVAEGNPTYDSRDNCNAIIETQTNTLIAGCSKTTIPNSVTSIGYYAFSYCSSLTSVVIPNSVTSIGDYAFDGCSSLTSVEIPNSVTSIGSGPFDGCSSLTTATVGCSWITNPLYEFDENVTVNATLHSYENGVCTVCGEASEDERIELVEGTPFENEEARKVAQVTYNRTLPNLKWNALYLPVEIPVSELRDNYDVAYFNNMHAYDRNNDGTVDEMDMEIFFITEGTLHANHPYFIRAKNNAAKQMNLVLTNVTLHSTEAANCTSITTSSAYMNFKLKGVYKRIYVSSTNIPVNPNPEAPISNDYDSDESIYGCYAITASGAWSPIAVGSYLNPFRLYLKMTDRDGTPVKMDQALQTIRIRVHGEDGTTDIEEHCINGQQSTTIYDLQGRRVVNPAKGIYIVNGKKVMIK